MHKLKYLLLMMLVGLGMESSLAWPAAREMLTGEISRSTLQQSPYGDWYQKYDQGYQVDRAMAAQFSPLLEDVDIVIIMGTWCHDSQRQVPRFYKILSAAGADLNRVKMVAVDMSFAAPDLDVAALGITNTPTFIFSRNGVEMNRIVESPVESLEQDMLAILKGAAYRHVKLATD